ncbi:uncharacterized protein LOC121529969 [Drosophila eugracilis]|uniref:uncharacterized protein LOC121529969 n=1 Tax=Drosophila eugracilis TaxID=29029 RepID=UPI001BD9E779|nr:uncharacterized protein LOC121529969 [Drosophila eugracilis]
MSGLAAVLLHLLIVSSWHGSLARPNEDCDRYCFSTMRTVMDHVVADHDQNSTCKAANDTRKGQNEIKVQLAALQEAVSSVRASQESKDVKLDRIKSQQVNMQESIQRLIPNVLQEKLGRTESQMKALESNKMEQRQRQMWESDESWSQQSGICQNKDEYKIVE